MIVESTSSRSSSSVRRKTCSKSLRLTIAHDLVPLVHDDKRLDALVQSARGRGHPNAARSIVAKVLELSQVA